MDTTNGYTGVAVDAASLTGDSVRRRAEAVSRDRDATATRKAAREFESLFIGMMLKSMRETVGKDPLTGGGRGEEVFRSLLDQEYAKAMAEQGGIGLAAMLESQLIKPAGGRGQATDVPPGKSEVAHEN